MKIQHFAIAVASIVALFVPLAGHTQVSTDQKIGWAALQGKPTIPVGKEAAIYIWRVDDHIFVETTNDSPTKGGKFTGRIRVIGGVIADDSGNGLENNDKLFRQGKETISFSFMTYGQDDQVEFLRKGGFQLRCDFALNGSRSVPVYYGASAVRAEGNPLFVLIEAMPEGTRSGSGSPILSGFTEPFSAASGTPTIRDGKGDGYYIYHNGSTVTVTTTSITGHSRVFSGTITANGGTITGTHPIGLESDDSFSQPSGNTLQFRFNTQNESDSIQFQLAGASTLNFALSSPGATAAQVYVGGNATPMNRGNLTFEVGK